MKPNEKRTTPPPSIDSLTILPELADCAAITVRLHARYGPQPASDASKVGGLFLWPRDEPWPVCEEHGIPYVTVLQLRAEDFPEMRFPPGRDLFQLLWCPQDHDIWIKPAVFWRSRSEVIHPRVDHPEPVPHVAPGEPPPKEKREMPAIDGEYLCGLPAAFRDAWLKKMRRECENPPMLRAFRDYLPTPCLLLPERVVEYPDFEDLPPQLRAKLEEPVELDELPPAVAATLRPTPSGINGMAVYCSLPCVCPGSKVGGHVCWIQGPEVPVCNCGRPMVHLLTLSSDECDGSSFWLPEEEQRYWNGYQNDALDATERAHGMMFGDVGKIYFFVCRHCPDWPVRHVGQCS